MYSKEHSAIVGICILLCILWVPSLVHPILSDTAVYALLGESVWHGQGYTLLGEPYAKHMPLHAIASYPFVALLGYSYGMKLSTLLAGTGVVLITYQIAKKLFSQKIALLSALLLVVHHGFVLTTHLGSADLLFALLSLLSFLFFLQAKEDPRRYLGVGITVGLACLTRYNGVPLFASYGLTLALWRRDDLKTHWPWTGAAIGGLLFSLWLMRNQLTFGTPLYTSYSNEFATEVPSVWSQLRSNLLYYANPLQNVLPLLLVFTLIGLVKGYREQKKLLLFVLGITSLSLVWHVQGMRFVLPAIPIMIIFGIHGFEILHSRTRTRIRIRLFFTTIIAVGILLSHGSALCLYTYGSCNGWFDTWHRRMLNWVLVPSDLGLTSEGMAERREALGWLNTYAREDASVIIDDPVLKTVWAQGVFREDLTLTDDTSSCPSYRIGREIREGEEAAYNTSPGPIEYVFRKECN